MSNRNRGTTLPDNEEYKLWLVWAMKNDRPALIAIDTSNERAQQHVLAEQFAARAREEPPPEIFVEESLANHLYGQTITDEKSFGYQMALKKLKIRRGETP